MIDTTITGHFVDHFSRRETAVHWCQDDPRESYFSLTTTWAKYINEYSFIFDMFDPNFHIDSLKWVHTP